MEEKFLIMRKDTLECPVCFHTPFDSFCVFPCGHSFCRSCTATVTSQLKSTWTGKKFCECPICHHRVAEKESQRPPRNFVVQNLLDSVTDMKVEFSGKEDVTEKEKKQLAGRIAEQWDRIERLEIANGKLSTRMNGLVWATLLIFIVALYFLVMMVFVATGTRGGVKNLVLADLITCLIDLTTWQRVLDHLLLRDTDYADKLINNALDLCRSWCRYQQALFVSRFLRFVIPHCYRFLRFVTAHCYRILFQ